MLRTDGSGMQPMRSGVAQRGGSNSNTRVQPLLVIGWVGFHHPYGAPLTR